MNIADGAERIDDSELLYRRIPESMGWYNPAEDERPSPLAFRPGQRDISGLSLYRAKHKLLEEAARGQAGKRYYIAVLRAGDLRACGMNVVQRPPEDPAHCEIPDLTFESRKQDEALEMQKRLAHELCIRVEGPFG